MTRPRTCWPLSRIGAPRSGLASGLAVATLVTLLCMPIQLARASGAAPDAPATSHGSSPPPSGKQLYEKWCAACHAAGPGHPGTLRLSVDRSPAQSVLVERHYLTVDYISTIVRVGFGFMPPFRATELTDPEVAAVARFITSQAAASHATTGK